MRRTEMKARIRNKFSRLAASVMAGVATMLVAASAFAQEAGAGGMGERDKYIALAAASASARGAGAGGWGERDRYIALAAGLGIGIAAFGGALGQGRAAAAALDGIARNPSAAGKLFTPMILGLALIESLVIYSLVISFVLVGKI